MTVITLLFPTAYYYVTPFSYYVQLRFSISFIKGATSYIVWNQYRSCCMSNKADNKFQKI